MSYDIHVPPRVLALIEIAASERDLLVRDVLSHRRQQKLCEARWAVWSILSGEGKSLTQIGHMFGKDHTTVLNGLRKHAALQPRLEAAE